MAESCIPAVIDWMVAEFAALPQCAPPVGVFDGWPAEPRPATGLAIGVTPEDPQAESLSVHAALGPNMEYESPVIPNTLWCYVNDDDPKGARDGAFAVLNALITRVRQDRSCGGAIHSGAALLTGVLVDQTVVPTDEGNGRQCQIRFSVVIDRNRF